MMDIDEAVEVVATLVGTWNAQGAEAVQIIQDELTRLREYEWMYNDLCR